MAGRTVARRQGTIEKPIARANKGPNTWNHFETLLHYLGVTSLILTGLATNSCIVCTAHDAKMRNFDLYVPSDCSAARTRREHERAIEHIKEMTCASVVASPSLRVGDLRGESRRRKRPKA